MRKKMPVEKHNLHVKKGDKVVVISGDSISEKDKPATVINVITKTNKVVVEGANIAKKAIKPQGKENFANIEAPIDSSKVMIYCTSCSKPTRVKYEVRDGKKVRVCKHCNAII